MHRVPWWFCLLVAWLTVAAYASLYTVAALTMTAPPGWETAQGALTRHMWNLAAGKWSLLFIWAAVTYVCLGRRQALAHIRAEIDARRPLPMVVFALLAVVLGFAITYGFDVALVNLV